MDILKAEQVAEILMVPQGTLRYWRHANKGPACFTLGRKIVYRRTEVEKWIAAQEQATRRGGN